ncbi:helix-turn-helix transcriptional regulator [uncultured Ralstonia sp.]|uniref:helix-turn-helix transcriptional regulator n=1 Tax=uncultured Ralstonia sp. TaxID=114715 RepID=UPI0025D7A741|nr:helix-turn-helix transcriptional regulator [uncultured Ralstonia sp.]
MLRQLYVAACTGSPADVMDVARVAWQVQHAAAMVRWRHDGRWRWVASHGACTPMLLWQAVHGAHAVISWPLADTDVHGLVWTTGPASPLVMPPAAPISVPDLLPHLAQALPLCWQRNAGTGDAAAQASEAVRLWLADVFRLTRREMDVADLLARGADPALIARTLGISLDTVRTHLKHVYRKTNTHSQCDVVRLMLASSHR